MILSILIIVIIVLLVRFEKIKLEVANVMVIILISFQLITSIYILFDPFVIYKKGEVKIDTYTIKENGIKYANKNNYSPEDIIEIATNKETFKLGYLDKVAETLEDIDKEDVEVYTYNYKIKSSLYDILLWVNQPKEKQLRIFNIHYPQQ